MKKPQRLWKRGKPLIQSCPISLGTAPDCRVRLFNLGDALSDAERKRRLKGQYKRMSRLRDMIFWTDVGEVGFTDYQKRLKRKQVALQMSTSLHADVTPEKAFKMISKAIEAQEKHDMAAKRRRASFAEQHRAQKLKGRQQRPPIRRRQQPQSRNSQQRPSSRSTSRSTPSSKTSRKSSSSYRS